MKALTLWQPWAWWVASGWKPIENRPWPPPRAALGTTIAIHAGKFFDTAALDFLSKSGLKPPAGYRGDLARVHGAILGTAKIIGCVETGQLVSTLSEKGHAACESPWFFGPYGWVLEEIRPLDAPVQCKGALGLWRLPTAVFAEVISHGGFAGGAA